jgi:hypothetical protein
MTKCEHDNEQEHYDKYVKEEYGADVHYSVSMFKFSNPEEAREWVRDRFPSLRSYPIMRHTAAVYEEKAGDV